MAIGPDYLIYLIIGICAIVLVGTTTILVIRRVLRGSKNKTFLSLIMFFIFLTVWAIASTIFPIFEESIARIIAIIVPISAYLGFYCLGPQYE